MNIRSRQVVQFRNFKGTNAVVIDNDALFSAALLFFGLMYLNVIDQFVQHTRCQLPNTGIFPYGFDEVFSRCRSSGEILQHAAEQAGFSLYFCLLLFVFAAGIATNPSVGV